MEQSDIQVLNKMKEAIAAFRSDGAEIGRLADQLLALRDGLQFREREWAHQLTQHIATLDSASTFVPANDGETRQLRAAITTAINGLLKLIEDRLA